RQRGTLSDHDPLDLVEHCLGVGGGHRLRHRHTRSNLSRISLSAPRPGPGSWPPVWATLLGSTHCQSSSPKTIRPVACSDVGSLPTRWPVATMNSLASLGRKW